MGGLCSIPVVYSHGCRSNRAQRPERPTAPTMSDTAANKGRNSSDETAPYVVDLSKPILSQVPKLGRHYDEWIHKPSSQPSFRMFESDFFELFATMSWYMVPIIWIPVSIAFGMAALSISSKPQAMSDVVPGSRNKSSAEEEDTMTMSTETFIFWWITGLCIWTITEYTLHRFVFHAPIVSTSNLYLRFHYLMHGQHHKFPLDKGRLVFPLVPATITSSVVYSVIYTVFPFAASLAIMSGLIIGYIFYDLTHYFLHHGKPDAGYFRTLKEHHMQHHYLNHHTGFGITSMFWDVAFSTLHSKKI